MYNIIIFYIYNSISQVKNEGYTGTAVLIADMLHLLSLIDVLIDFIQNKLLRVK